MPIYYVDKRALNGGAHEMHDYDCKHKPDTVNRYMLGFFLSCEEAINEAKKYYKNINVCNCCSHDFYRKRSIKNKT